MSKIARSVKNVAKGYSQSQIKVREATSNDPWGPTGTQMSEIAHLTFNSSTEFYDIMDMIDKRLNDKGKNWRHVLKALKVLDYCLHEGSELAVTWARANVYIIKTLREFQYIDEEGRDVGQNVRVAAKEITALILDENRLRSERSDRKSWKSRVMGPDECGLPPTSDLPQPQQRRPRPRPPQNPTEEEDAEYRLAIEASKHQEEEDRKRRESRSGTGVDDDDLAKAIKLSKEEEEARRRKEQEEADASLLFDDEPAQASQPTSQPMYTGFNQGYQQGSGVDFFGNPIDNPNLQMAQPTGYMQQQQQPAYTGYPQQTGFQPQQSGFQQPQQTGFPSYQPQQQQNGFGMGMDPYGQQTLSPFQQAQPTGYNGYGQQQQQQGSLQSLPESTLNPGSNNPWATRGALQPSHTGAPPNSGSNNPFGPSFNRPQTSNSFRAPSLGSMPEQKTLSTFNSHNSNDFGQPSMTTFPSPPPQASFSSPPPQQQQQQQKEMTEHEARLNTLLANGDGMDTFGNTGNLRIPSQHTAPGTFVNSAGAGVGRLTAEATGSNPFMRAQMTAAPGLGGGFGGLQPQMGAMTGYPSMNGGGGQSNNPFAGSTRSQPANSQNGDLIQF